MRTYVYPVFFLFLFLFLLIVSGCNRSLESVAISIQDVDHRGIEVEDLGRRAPEAEARVVPISESDRPFRYRISSSGGEPLELGFEDPRIVITITGDISGGELVVFGGDIANRYRYSDSVVDTRTNPSSTYRLSFPLDMRRVSPWEIEFRAAPGSEGYTVERIAFEQVDPAILLAVDQDRSIIAVDSLLPVRLSDDKITVPVLAGVLRDHTHGLIIDYHAPDELFSNRSNRPTAYLVLGGEGNAEMRLDLRLQPGDSRVVLRPRRWMRDADSITVTGLPDLSVHALSPISIPADPMEPILIELEELQSWSPELWRREDFELFRWSAYPRILWMDHRSYETQSRMFRRLAFFVEKRGYQGRLLTNEELAERHGWNAHNYRPEGLADFFNAVEELEFQINSLEVELREIALREGLLVENADGGGPRWLPGTGGVLSISQDSFPALRRLLTVHEAMHGVFYEEPALRRAAFDHWDRDLSQREREFWQLFFRWMSYDPDDRYLMVNEFQAYLLQQGEANATWYFGTRTADRLRMALPDRSESIDLLLRDYPDTFRRAAAVVNEALFSASGMVGGDPFSLRERN